MSERNEKDSRARAAERCRRITVVVLNYNGRRTVLETLGSVLRLEGVRSEIVVVDDGSDDGSPEAIAQAFPDVMIHREPANTKQANRLRNVGLAAAGTEKVLIVDNDVILDPACARELLDAMDADPAVAAAIPRMMYARDPSIVYMAGGAMHYVGATIAPHRHEPFDGRIEPRPAVGGGIMMLDRRKAVAVGGFDEHYRLAWGDDIELHQRLLLAGHKCIYVPTAVCFHDYKRFDRSRYYRARGQVRNRLHYLLTHHELRTLLVCAPALLLYELVQAGFLTAKGLPGLYFGGTLDALKALRATLRRRRFVQALRIVPDRDVLFAGPMYVRPEHARPARALAGAVRLLDRVFALHWAIVRRLLSKSPPAGREAVECGSTRGASAQSMDARNQSRT